MHTGSPLFDCRDLSSGVKQVNLITAQNVKDVFSSVVKSLLGTCRHFCAQYNHLRC